MSKIKKSAKHGNFIIEQAENDTVSIIFDNTRQALRDIANEIGMEYDPDWNTRYFGHRLINFINGVDTTKKSKEVKESDSNTYRISDTDWEWWVSLSDSLKYTFIKNTEYTFRDQVCEEIPYFEDDELQSEVDLNDKSKMADYVAECITGYYNEEGEFEYGETLIGIAIPDDAFGLEDLHKIAHLKHLEGLSFYYNGLDIIPSDIGKLTQLKKLSLHRNEISADDSLDELSTLTNLEELNLSNNLLSDGNMEYFESLTKLTALKKLDLSNNRFDAESGATVLGKIAQLSNLEELDFNGNRLSDCDLSALSKLTNLRKLDLGYNDLESFAGCLDKLAHLRNLEKLNLVGNRFDTYDFSLLSNFTKLEELDLSRNEVSLPAALDVSPLSNLTELRMLDFNSGGLTITDNLLKELCSLPNLKYLNLCGNSFSAENIGVLAELLKNRDSYFDLTIFGWGDHPGKESEEYKKLQEFFKEKGWCLN
ncbi:leucine-rich repeat domain-containing protein [Pelistega suis]|uniref:leucine-rich repeat domain-containing protein n=1 Tax=Pelistega suis TaxID=1631957 RepID=UPI00211BB30B|nr:leucine-rich repeat domain-containing protein [Pelistega suis]MCQ9328821.1 leucine-rich repeat domain-containing protein [Pelistega suis]